MKYQFILFISLIISISAFSQEGFIINHKHTDISLIPDEWITAAKKNLKIRYFRRSHGSQIDLGGMAALRRYSQEYNSKYAYNLTGANNELMLSVQPSNSWNSLDFENATWVQITRNYLDLPANSNVNVIMWAWSSSFFLCDPYKYIADMESLIGEYGPGGSKIQSGERTVPVTFVFQTACGSRSIERNPIIFAGNKIIREHCITNNRVLFDFNDLECYNPDGVYYGDADQNGNYTNVRRLNDDLAYFSSNPGGSVYAGCRNWGIDWNNANPNTELARLSASAICTSCSHSQGSVEGEVKDNSRLHCVLKGRAAWWLWSKIAGWKDNSLTISSNIEIDENNLNDAIIHLSLNGEYFIDQNLLLTNFQLIGAPPGTSIESVQYLDNSNIKISLAFNGTDFDVNYNQFTIRILAPELSMGSNLTGNSIPIHAIDEPDTTTETIWTGLISSEWCNPENWSFGVPDLSKNVIIPEVSPFEPIIDCNARTKGLTINEGAYLTINPMGSATIYGKLNINGSLLLKCDEISSACMINMDSILYGRFASVKTETFLSGRKFHYLSVPFDSVHSDRFKSDPVFPYKNPNFYFWDETFVGKNFTDGWRSFDGLMEVMKGYSAYYSSDTKIVLDRSKSGNLNTGNKSKLLTYTGTNTNLPVINRGWNLVGNPYPAYLDWNDAGWTKTNIFNSIYFWNGSNYSYYVSDGTAQDNGIGVNNGSNFIPPMQAFFVKVIGDDNSNHSGSLVIPESARTTDITGFYKKITESDDNCLRLKLTGNGHSDETALRILENSSYNFDNEYDAFKLFTDPIYGVPQIFTLTDDKIPQAINSLPDYFENLQIRIGISVMVNGYYTITSGNLRLTDGLKLWLVDLQEDVYLNAGSLHYTFYSVSGQFENRFRLICLKNPQVMNNRLKKSQMFNIDLIHYGVRIKSIDSKPINGVILIYNPIGQVVYNTKNCTEESLVINLSKIKTGIYLIKVTNAYGIYTERVFIRGD